MVSRVSFVSSRNTLEFEFEEWVRHCGKETGYIFVSFLAFSSLLHLLCDEKLTAPFSLFARSFFPFQTSNVHDKPSNPDDEYVHSLLYSPRRFASMN